MAKTSGRTKHVDPPGWDSVRGPSEAPEHRVRATSNDSHDDANEARIQECEEELENRREAIMALRDVVMKQRATIRSLQSERPASLPPTYPLQEIREEASSLSDSTSGESNTSRFVDSKRSPPSSFDPSNGIEDFEEEEDVSAITCDDEESTIDSNDFVKMESEIQAVMEAAKARPFSPLDSEISFEQPSSIEPVPPPKTSRKVTANDGITSVIEALQEQASHVDAVIALDNLQTTKNELQNVASELRHRNEEIDQLKSTVKVLENKISNLELERDLHVSGLLVSAL